MTTVTERTLGHSGLQVSAVGLGCNNFGRRVDARGTRLVIDACLEHGITFLDTADIYGGGGSSEALLGEALRGRRGQVVLATKFGMDMGEAAPAAGPRGSGEYVRRAAEASLRRLQTDVIDLYWYHQPDGVTPIEETLGALHELVDAGIVRAIGASNFSALQIEEADRAARADDLTRFTAVQNEYSLLQREPETDGVLEVCSRLDLALIPYFPLASGLLTGKYRRGAAGPEGARLTGRDQIASEEQWDLVEALGSYADERGVALSEVAIGALLAKPEVASVIAGATKPEQVQSNAAAARWQPSQDDVDALARVLSEHPG
jgi:aryl-alcohol dehydrogenase-like predicted oxidoreductase